jgi:hypothetical protein
MEFLRERRAADLLRNNLSEDQWRAACDGQYIRVQGQYSKATYLIDQRAKVWVASDAHRATRLCVYATQLPVDDCRLAFALYAAHDERRLLERAGFYPECNCRRCRRVIAKLEALSANGPIGLRWYLYRFW